MLASETEWIGDLECVDLIKDENFSKVWGYQKSSKLVIENYDKFWSIVNFMTDKPN